MKDLLITHVDLDGISPVILLKLTGREFDYKTIEINEVDETFNELFELDLKNIYENIYITDLTLTENVYNKINELGLKNVKVFDHHETHLFANTYPFVNVSIDIDGRQTCGTELFYLFLNKTYKFKNNVKEYVDYVRELDTYNFTSELPKKLDLLKNTYGNTDFIKSIFKRLSKEKEHFELTAFEKRFLKLKSDEVQRYMQKKEDKMFVYKIQDKECGIVFAETNKSELGNYLSNRHPELDLIILIDASSRISYRTSRDDVKVNDFASIYGGGGHAKASGSSFDDNFRDQIIKLYYDKATKIERENI